MRRRQNTPMPGQAIRAQDTDVEGPQAVRLISVVQSRRAMEGGPLLRGSTIAYMCGPWGQHGSESMSDVRWMAPRQDRAGGGTTKPLPDRDVREGGWGRVDPTPGIVGLHERNVESEQGEPTNVTTGSMTRRRPKKKRICGGQSRHGGWEEEYKVSQLRHCGWEYEPRG